MAFKKSIEEEEIEELNEGSTENENDEKELPNHLWSHVKTLI